MKRLFIYYGFLLATVMTAVGFLGVQTIPELIAAVAFFPMFVFFGTQVLPRNNRALIIPEIIPKTAKTLKVRTKLKRLSATPTDITSVPSFDNSRRTFLKLIGSAGLTMLFFSLFTGKAHAAFFGSVPGPGTVAIKDSSGNQIDPAISTPTDGYKVSDLDSSSPSYYGFIDKTGRWFIMKEGSSGDYRYCKGASSYSTNWTNRASLTYDTFDAIF